ncbi:hypothetical protein COU79_02845, partial [Candidatus Peregrinibacteria bacterium CG10_big_fil_rev_8_21_14_0_10_54_7]
EMARGIDKFLFGWNCHGAGGKRVEAQRTVDGISILSCLPASIRLDAEDFPCVRDQDRSDRPEVVEQLY